MDEFNDNFESLETDNSVKFPSTGILFVSITLMLICIMCWQLIYKVFGKVLCCDRCSCCRGGGDDDDSGYGDDDLSYLRNNNNNNNITDSNGNNLTIPIDLDQILALALQHRFDEEASEQSKMAKRKERRKWYEYYLKPWTMTVRKCDLIHSSNNKDNYDEDGTITVQTGSKTTGTSLNSDTEEVGVNSDIEDGRSDSGGGGEGVAHLRLPASVGHRCVDGTCSLCLEEYEAGDEVVWSSCQECTHVFHNECLMQWLSKGKKRCPICRNWFVPGQRIDEQKLMHGTAWIKALAEMEKRESEQETSRERQRLRQQQQQQQQQQLEAEAERALAVAAKAEAVEAAANEQQQGSFTLERRTLETSASLKSVETCETHEL